MGHVCLFVKDFQSDCSLAFATESKNRVFDVADAETFANRTLKEMEGRKKSHAAPGAFTGIAMSTG